MRRGPANTANNRSLRSNFGAQSGYGSGYTKSNLSHSNSTAHYPSLPNPNQALDPHCARHPAPSASTSTLHQQYHQHQQSLDEEEGEGDELDMLQPLEVRRVPPEQEHLSPQQLDQKIKKELRAHDPNSLAAAVSFDYHSGHFVPYATRLDMDHLAVHFAMDGVLIHVQSKEAKEQEEAAKELRLAHLERKSTGMQTSTGDEEDGDVVLAGGGRVLKNQFNFSERASQTFNNPMRDRKVSTEPPPTSSFSFNISPSELYDAYMDDLSKQMRAKGLTKDGKPRTAQSDEEERLSLHTSSPSEVWASSSLLHAMGMMERLVVHNAQSDTFHDFKYFEHFPDGKAFLSLWKFSYKPSVKSLSLALPDRNINTLSAGKTVTAIQWNPTFHDLFAVGYGSYDFMRQGAGLICCFTLKNTAHPAFIFHTHAGVVSLDFHPQHPFLLAVGLYDGSVCVYDVRVKNGQPLFQSTDPKMKHSEPVWQVSWRRDYDPSSSSSSSPATSLPASSSSSSSSSSSASSTSPSSASASGASSASSSSASSSSSAVAMGYRSSLSFYSVSSDGKLTTWTLHKNELLSEETMELKMKASPLAGAGNEDKESKQHESRVRHREQASEEVSSVGAASGSCFHFHPSLPHLFVVGSEEGRVHSYSKAYTSQFLTAYEGHDMSVYSVCWNPYHPGIFLTCSADWSIKLWEVNTQSPIMSWDHNTGVGDVAWAPFSSTVFAAITNDGKLRVYDLAQNKHEPIGVTQVTKKARATHVAFNQQHAVVAVGDDHGNVHILKLSANLHKMSAPRLSDISPAEEIDKLSRLLIIPEPDASSFVHNFHRVTVPLGLDHNHNHKVKHDPKKAGAKHEESKKNDQDEATKDDSNRSIRLPSASPSRAGLSSARHGAAANGPLSPKSSR